MTTEAIITIVVAVLGSNLIQFFVTRGDNKKGIKAQLLKLEKDSCRTQMLILLKFFPERTDEIMTLAEHYFGTLHGDWWLTPMFSAYLDEHGFPTPAWFNSKGDKQ